eukprot:gene10180-7258_t
MSRWFTAMPRDFDAPVGYLAQSMDEKSITAMLGSKRIELMNTFDARNDNFVEELSQRRFLFLDNVSFIAVSAFANAGMALASDSIVGLSDNPSAC